MREPAWRADILKKPLAERHALAAALRERSENAKAGKRPEIMDVNPDAVAEAFRRDRLSRIITATPTVPRTTSSTSMAAPASAGYCPTGTTRPAVIWPATPRLPRGSVAVTHLIQCPLYYVNNMGNSYITRLSFASNLF